MLAGLIAFTGLVAPGLVVQGGTVIDGSGGAPFKADVRIVGDTIQAVGRHLARPGDQVIDATGLCLSPGFIDCHSHADGGIDKDPDAETHIRQGITTSMVGEDGGSAKSIAGFFDQLRTTPSSMNFGSFAGEGTVREMVMGMQTRKPTADELHKMETWVDDQMKAGAMGLSTGLEYEPNRYADTDEVIDLAKVTARRHGIYISHVRNEDVNAFKSFTELIKIATDAHMPGEINHIKIASASVWHKAPEVIKMMNEAAAKGVDITADVYPYLYWQSTIRVLITTEQWDDRKQWEEGLAQIGGPDHVRLTSFSPDPSWAGHTIKELADQQGKDPIALIQEVIDRCYLHGNHGEESVAVTAMSEDDLKTFIGCPKIMFCSDGPLHGSHPRCAGSFPRILAKYVREDHVITLPEAIRKMTSMAAWRFGLKDRGLLKRGYKADVVLFNPDTVQDTATIENPEAAPIGIPTVIVNGGIVQRDGIATHVHTGTPLLHR